MTDASQKISLGEALLLGDSPEVAQLRAQVDAAVKSDANVLLLGSGDWSAAEVARTIHERSENDAALVAVDAALIAGEQIVSRVAAARRYAGGKPIALLITDADRLSPEAQRMLADYWRSNAPGRLMACVESDTTFIAELTMLAATIIAHVPRLGDRMADLPALAERCLQTCQDNETLRVTSISPAAIERLALYPWPGELDELLRVIAQAVLKCEGDTLTEADLPAVIQQALAAAEHPSPVDEAIDLDAYLGQIERELIERALDRAAGNKTEAARLLGMSRPRLYRRLVQLGLVEPPSKAVAEAPREDGKREAESGDEIEFVEADESPEEDDDA